MHCVRSNTNGQTKTFSGLDKTDHEYLQHILADSVIEPAPSRYY